MREAGMISRPPFFSPRERYPADSLVAKAALLLSRGRRFLCLNMDAGGAQSQTEFGPVRLRTG